MTAGIRHQAPTVMWAMTRADLVRIGKFDVDAAPRFLAFYPPPFNQGLRVQAKLGGGRPGIGRAIRPAARRRPRPPASLPQCSTTGPGWDGSDFSWRSWSTVGTPGDGTAPTTGSELFERMHRLQTAVRIEGKQLSSVLHRDSPSRWAAVVERYDMAEPLARAVETLTDRDAAVCVSLTPCCRRDRPPSRPLLAAGRHGSQRRLDFA